MKKISTLAILLLAISLISVAQQAVPAIQWSKCFGGSLEERGHSIASTTDGNFVIVGEAWSNDGDLAGNISNGRVNVWVIKIDSAGNLLWQKTYGGSSWDMGRFITATPDGGSIFVAHTLSNDGQVSGYHGSWDI